MAGTFRLHLDTVLVAVAIVACALALLMPHVDVLFNPGSPSADIPRTPAPTIPAARTKSRTFFTDPAPPASRPD